MRFVRFKCIASILLSMIVVFIALISTSCTVKNEGYQHVIGVSQIQTSDVWNSTFRSMLSIYGDNDESMNFVFLDAAGDVIRQKKDIEELSGMHVDALIVVPDNIEFLEDTLREVKGNGCIVGIAGKAVQNEQLYTFNIYPDNYRTGYLAGQYLAECLDGGVNVLEILGEIDTHRSQEISAGFREALENHENIKVPYVLAGNDSRDMVKERAVEILLKKPAADAVFAQSDAMAWGASIALKNLGQSALVVGVGTWDETTEIQTLVDKELIDATVYIPCGASEAITQLQKAFGGQDVSEQIAIQPRIVQ